MTDEQIIREVAEKVMGWKFEASESNRFLDYWYNPESGFCIWVDIWNPLTNANYWMMVIERMIEKGFLLKLGYGLTVQGLLAWVKFTKEPESIYHHNKSIGKAICLAALESVRTQSVATKSPQ